MCAKALRDIMLITLVLPNTGIQLHHFPVILFGIAQQRRTHIPDGRNDQLQGDTPLCNTPFHLNVKNVV